MWIYLKDAFLSVVVDRDDPNRLLVRGRFRGDIECVLPKAEVIETPRADYRFRASVPRALVAEMLAGQALTMSTDNFKGSVEEDWRHDVYLDVWSTMQAAQQHYQAWRKNDPQRSAAAAQAPPQDITPQRIAAGESR